MKLNHLWGLTILELLVASCMASGLLMVVFQFYIKLAHVAAIQQNVAREQKQQLWAYHFFWRQLVNAGFAGRCNLRQLNLDVDGEQVWQHGVYGYDHQYLPPFLAHKGAVSDVLQLAYAVDYWVELPRDLNPLDSDQIVKLPANVFSSQTNHHLLVEDGERSEAVAVNQDGLHADNCRYLHYRAAARVYPLRRVSFFIGYNRKGDRKSLYRVVGYGRKEELLRGIDAMQCWFGVVDDDSFRMVRYYKASEVTARSLWSAVIAVRLELTWHASDTPLIVVARLRNLDL